MNLIKSKKDPQIKGQILLCFFLDGTRINVDSKFPYANPTEDVRDR